MVAAATLILGMFPALVIWLGKLTGINYAPVLPIIIGLSMVLLRLLKLDIDRSRQERQVRRLTQKLAILEQEIEQLRGLAGTDPAVAPKPAAPADRDLR
jgi:hypothetical protein